MAIFDYVNEESIGLVESVDTSTVVIRINDEKKLCQLQVNQLVVIRSSKVGQHLIGLVTKIMRKCYMEPIDKEVDVTNESINNIIKVTLIGTHIDKYGTRENVFKRTLETVPEINAECFILTGERLTKFMKSISYQASKDGVPLSLGHYTLDDEAEAWVDGNKFFQRHAVIVGSTGSGKSWSVARLIEQISELKSANAVLFDIHGEYEPIKGACINHIKIAGPNDIPSDNIIFLPYWLLTYEEMLSLMLDRSDSNAPNQAMAFSNVVIQTKKKYLAEQKKDTLLNNFTIDSPIPYDLKEVFNQLKILDSEMVQGVKSEKQGPLHGKLTRFIQRLHAKVEDKRLNFLFNSDIKLMEYEYMEDLCSLLMSPSCINHCKGVKIIDFSEVPSDILPLIVSLIARVIFSVQQWVDKNKRHPIAIFCDEAHLYIPSNAEKSIDITSLQSFERIAKEGRKYGVGLVVISQRPAEVNRTVLSQSSNFISMRLTNADDQNVVKRLLPDSLGNFADLLPILDVGEALVVGDACLLPSRIRIKEPHLKPNSATIDFWTEWSKEITDDVISEAVEALRKQAK